MEIKFENGERYALNVWTYNFFSKAIKEMKIQNENLNGLYLIPPDLFVEKADRRIIEDCVKDLISNNSLKDEWKIIK